jgi:hypothetical protein
VVAGELPREAHNAPLHLFSASADLVGFGRMAYRRRSEKTSLVLGQLFEQIRGEGWAMAYTMEDFERDYIKKHLPRLTVREQEEVLQGLSAEVRLAGLPAEVRLAGLPAEARLAGLPAEARLAGLPVEQIRRYLDQTAAGRKTRSRTPRRKK